MSAPAGYPPLPGIPRYGEVVTWIFFISAILWVPYSIYLFHCFWESRKRNLFPQAFILFLLALGTGCRCCWFCLAAYYVDTPGIETLNRVAILLQFSAVTLVMLMWSRAFKIAELNNGGRQSRHPSSLTMPHSSTNGHSQAGTSNSNTIISSGVHTGGVYGLSKDREAMKARQIAQQMIMQQRKMVCLALNFAIWFAILFTLLYHFSNNNSSELYAASEVVLACCCLFVSIGILVIGLNNYHRIRSELQPVYVLAGTNQPTKHVYTAFLRFLVGNLDIANEHTLQAQTQILRTILKVSIVVSFFYAIRAFLYVWTLYYSRTTLPLYTYPLLFFQCPEFFPSIVIVRGISVSTGYGKPPIVTSNSTMLEIMNYKVQAYVGLVLRLVCCYCVTPVLVHRTSMCDEALPSEGGNMIDGYPQQQWPTPSMDSVAVGGSLPPIVENPMNAGGEEDVTTPGSGLRKVPNASNINTLAAAHDRGTHSSRAYSDASGVFIDGDSAAGSAPRVMGAPDPRGSSMMGRVNSNFTNDTFSRVNSHIGNDPYALSRVNTTGTAYEGRDESSFGYTGRLRDRESDASAVYAGRDSGYTDARDSSLVNMNGRGSTMVGHQSVYPNTNDEEEGFVDVERNSLQMNPVKK